jgi:hypothetical protein
MLILVPCLFLVLLMGSAGECLLLKHLISVVLLNLSIISIKYNNLATQVKLTCLGAVILSRILYLVSSHPPARPSVHISSRTMKMAKSYPLESGNDFDMRRRNLSSTLQEIYAWEKKLYKEVRVWGNDVVGFFFGCHDFIFLIFT